MKKLRLALSFIVILAAMTLIVGCEAGVEASNSYVTIDINPSIELIVSPKNKVIAANPLNEDAEIVLSELDLIGMELEDAVDLIIETAIELGYIATGDDVETFVSVSTISKDDALKERIHNRVKASINKAFENRGMLGKASDKVFTEEFILEAQSYDVTPQFLFLAQKIVELNDELILEDVLAMTQEELLDIIDLARAEHKEVVEALKTEFFAARQVLFDQYRPLIQALNVQILDVESQIAALAEGEDATILTATLTDLENQLNTLKTEFHDLLAVLRDDFHAQSTPFMDQFKAEQQRRRNEYQEQINQFKDNMKQRRDQMRDRIKAYQDEKNNDKNDNGSNGKK